LKLAVLKALVETHGGTVTSTIEDADLIITTVEDVAADSNKKLKKAFAEKKPVLLPTFLLESVAKTELQDPKEFSAMSASTGAAAATDSSDAWTGLASKVQSGRQKSGAKLASVGPAAAASRSGAGLGKSGGAKVQLKIKGRGAVDEASGLVDTAHIYEEKNDVYTFTGNSTDITTSVESWWPFMHIVG
jgi:hypothetical protein